MSHLLLTLATLTLLPVLAVIVSGLINRVKSLWAGRRGPPILQLAFDLLRLLRKRPVRSTVATSVFRLGPFVVLATTLASSLVVPLFGSEAPLGFRFDFVWFAYVWGLGRVALVLGALDTGSAFEGMGASREMTYSALVEPALFLVAGTLFVATREASFGRALTHYPGDWLGLFVWGGSVAGLLVVVLVESARMPVDDPQTHLELTMIHEVMILDHSGPDLAAVQAGAAVKLATACALVANLINPVPADAGRLAVAGGLLAASVGVALVIGAVEATVARLRLRAVPQYILIAVVASMVAVLATRWRGLA